MKKLMTVVSVAATLLAFGAVNGDEVRTFTNTDFEDNPPYKAGELLSTTNDDAGKVAGESGFAATWVALPADVEEEHTIKAYDAEGAEPTPTKFASEVGSQYLYVETATSNLLERYVQPGGAAASIGDGIYLDTLVKFTPADQPFVESDVANGDKIAISYVGQDPSEVGDGETPISNIVVRAGYVSGSSIVSTNYVMNLPDNADFDVNAWHRLTVRSIANVGSSVAPVGFAIYIDGNPKPLTYASNVAAGDSAYEGALNAAVQTYLYNGEKHALLPSLVANGGTDFDKLTTVGFKGSGCVDNLAFTADPGFIEEGTAVEIAWDEGVATYTVVDNENNTLVDGAVTGGTEGSTNLLLEVGITNLTVTATYGTGYEAGTWTVTGDGAAISGSTFTVAEGAKLNINSMTPKFDVGGVHYGTFADALAAAVAAGTSAEPATIQLLADVDSILTFTEGYIILDLNGKTIQGGDLDTYSVVNSGATLTIIDSATGGTVAAPTCADAEGAFYTDDGSTTINGGIFASTVFTEKMLDSEASGDIVVTAGSFYDPDYDPEDSESKFYLADYLGDGVKTTYNAKYFTVGEPLIGTYTVTVTPNANATYSAAYNDGGAAVEFVNDVAAVTVGKTITITAAPASGYEYADTPTGWTAGQDGKITIEVSAEATVAIPAPTKEQSSDDWPTGQDLDDVAGTAAETAFPGITNALAAADAKAVATWATANSVEYSDKGSILPEAFLLNCANTQAAIDEAAANFKVTAITVVGDTVTITPADGADYGNGKVVIEGTATLSPISWHEKTDGDHFFRATLVVKPVAAP